MQLVAYGAQDIYLTGNTNTTLETTHETPLETSHETSHETPNLTFPLQFWFTRNTNLAIPLVSIPFAEQNINLGITYNNYDYYDHILKLTEELIEIDRYPEKTFLCGKANIQSSFLEKSRAKNLHKKHNLEEQDNESPLNKKAKLG